MEKKFALASVVSAALVAASASAVAGVPRDLAYPSGGNLTADQIMQQVYFVNHFYAMKNYSIIQDGDKITVLINKAAGEAPTTVELERFLNNEYTDGVTQAKDLAIFRSGKLRGTGMLITDYVDDAKSQSYMIWLPALQKIRRFAQPAQDDAWGGTDFTFGDVALLKPDHETHELLGKEKFNDCLSVMELSADEKANIRAAMPSPDCSSKGKDMYKVKSTTKFQNWWYDYRVSYIDTTTFADARTEYFKGDNKVKLIDRSWTSAGLKDPRGQNWGYWYGKTYATNHETWAVIPPGVTRVDQPYEESLWSEATLLKIKR